MNNYLYYPRNESTAQICKHSPDGRHRFSPPSINCDFCSFGGVIMGDEVLYVPTDRGVDYHARIEPNVLFWGGRGSAKSTTGRWDAHMRALAHPGFKYCILRRTYPELQKSHLTFIHAEMNKLGGVFNSTDKIAKYPNGSLGFYSHCQSDQDVLNLLSSEFALMFFDELSTFEWEMFVKLSASVRVNVGSGLTAMVRAATNPLGPSAEQINKYFVLHDVEPEEDPDYNPEDWYSIHANVSENPHVDQKQYIKRFSAMPSHVRKAWVDGEFALENSLFDFIPTIKNDKGDRIPYHVVNEIDLAKIINASTIYRAVDVGWFPDPTICLWIAHLGNRHIVLKEKLWYKTIAADVASDIKAIDKDLGISRVAITYCDPSMDINTVADVRTIKEIFEVNGIPMECSINNREMFASTMHAALAEEALPGTPRLQFYSKGCPYLIKTIPQQRYNPKKPLAMADHKEDHGVVACAYYLMSHSSDPRNESSSFSPTKSRPWMKPKAGERFILGNDSIRNR